jgi:hypothetical protein
MLRGVGSPEHLFAGSEETLASLRSRINASMSGVPF